MFIEKWYLVLVNKSPRNTEYFNFETNPKLNETFEENISPDYLIPILPNIAGQPCERALTSLKYFCENAPDYHIIYMVCFNSLRNISAAFDRKAVLFQINA